MYSCLKETFYILLSQYATVTTTVVSVCSTLWCTSKQDKQVVVCVSTVVETPQEGSARHVLSSSTPDQTENRLMKMCVQVGEGIRASKYELHFSENVHI